MGKAELTSEFILQKVAPYFNLHGYHGTSMSGITEITGLTKGAIYGNFGSKEDLAVEAFRFNVKKLISNISVLVNEQERSYDKLLAIAEFYSNYMEYSEKLGGCPVLKVGTDSLNNNFALSEKVKSITIKLKKSIQDIIYDGQCDHEIQDSIDAKKMANVIYGIIEGGIFLSSLLNDEQPLLDNIDHVKTVINNMKL